MADDGKFDVTTIAGLFELTPRRVQQLAKDGYIPSDERGRYSLVHSVRGYIRYLKEHGRETGRGTEHARLASAQALKVEMSNWRAMGELQTTQQVNETCTGLVVLVRSIHDSLPGRLSNELAAISEPTLVYQRLQTEFRACNLQLADYLQKRADALDAMPDPRTAVQPAGTADPDGVGED